MKDIILNKNHNYIGMYLTHRCRLKCPWCINLYDKRKKSKEMSTEDWVRALNRLELPPNLPITLQGGEPTLHKDFYNIVYSVRLGIDFDLLTNGMFNVDDFIKNVPVCKFNREAPYPSIRISYHPSQNKIVDLVLKALKLQEAGFSVGIYSILFPDEDLKKFIFFAQKECKKIGILFKTKHYLGRWKGKLYGHYAYDKSTGEKTLKKCLCRIKNELIISPSGGVYKCHSDLYNTREPIGHILDADFDIGIINKFKKCNYYGSCNPCDVKIKTNSEQIYGYVAAEIKKIEKI